MADRYWVGGTGNWSDDTNHWATSSGGAAGAGNKPTASDSAFFDASSGAGTVTIDAAATCLDFNQQALSTITTFAGTATLAVSGSFTLGLLTTWSATGTITFNATATGKTITTTGTTINGSLIFNGSGGGWTLQDNLTTTPKSITLTAGTLDTNGKTVVVSVFQTTGTSTKTLTLGSSAINISGNWNMSASGLTLNTDTSTITTSGVQNPSFFGGGFTYNNVNWTGINLDCTFSGANTFANLTVGNAGGGGGRTAGLSLVNNQTITGTFTATGDTSIVRIFLKSDTLGTTRTITAAAVSLTNVDFQDITGAGAATWSGTSIGNALGNSNITFTTPTTRYWVGGTGNWSSTTEWAASSGGASGASVPLCHDTVVFDANSFTAGSQTVTANMYLLGASVNFTGVTNNPTVSFSTTVQCFIFGPLTLASGMTITSNTGTLNLGTRSSDNLTSNSVTFGCNLTIDSGGGTITIQDDLVLNSARTLTLTNGTFNANNLSVTAGKFSSANSNIRTLTMGSGTWTVNGTGTVWSTSTATNLTLNANTSTIVISDTSATGKTITTSTTTLNNVTISGDNVTWIGDTTIAGVLALNNAGLTNGLKMGTGIKTITGSFTTNGSSGNLAKLLSSSAGTARTITKTSGNVAVNFMSIQDSTATGGARWYAGGNSTSVSGNSGWIFTSLIIVSGTAEPTATETEIVTGGQTIILTALNDTWVAAGATFDGQRQNIINGIDSAQSEAAGWDAVVKATQGVAGVARTSDTVVTITLDAFATYSITASETITPTIPATAITSAVAAVAVPTFQVTADVAATAIKDMISMGVILFPR